MQDSPLMPLPCANTAWLAVETMPDVLRRVPESATSWLSESEQQRLGTLRHPQRRQQYIAGHWLVRELLAIARGGDAIDYRLEQTRGNAPQTIGIEQPTFLSISHSGDWIAAAVADAPVGVDIEQRPRRLDRSIEASLLEPGEAAGSLDDDQLLRRWVAKEAWLKARGESALPERLQQLRLRDAPIESASVRLISDRRFWLALALSAGTPIACIGTNVRWEPHGARDLDIQPDCGT